MCLNRSYAAMGRKITVPGDAPDRSDSRGDLRLAVGSSRSRAKPERVESHPPGEATCGACSVLPRDADLDFWTPGATEMRAALLFQADHSWNAQPSDGD